MKFFTILLCILFSSSAMAAACAKPDEKTGIDTRLLQNDLTVASIACDQSSRYNQFVSRFGGVLRDKSGAMQRYFQRVYGRGGNTQMDKFVTRIANDASSRSLQISERKACDGSARLFDALLIMSPKQFDSYLSSQDFTSRHKIKACK